MSKSNLSQALFFLFLNILCNFVRVNSTLSVVMNPVILIFGVFSIQECLAPKCMFACCAVGRKDMVNEYS